jgi:1,4-alpha-glucan branching enzyme
MSENRYDAIGVANGMEATGCWFDPIMFAAWDCIASRTAEPSLMRALNSAKDFAPGRGPVTYIENHDHSTVANKAGGRAFWYRTQPAAIALYTCAGAVMVHNGQEFGDDYFLPEEGYERVQPRPLHWRYLNDEAGGRLFWLYCALAKIRAAHPALRGPNFYPEYYETHFNDRGYGVDRTRGLAIYRRWLTLENGKTDEVVVALNFSDADQTVDIPFPADGRWEETLNGGSVEVGGGWAKGFTVGSNWGNVFCRCA